MATGDSQGPTPIPEIWTPDLLAKTISPPRRPTPTGGLRTSGTEGGPPSGTGRQRPRHAHARKRVRRRLPAVVAGLCWLVLVGLAVVAVLRIVAWDVFQPFAVLNDLTAFIYLPAWIIAAVALLGRRPVLAVAALVIVAAQVAFMLPELHGGCAHSPWIAGAPSIRVLDANVYDGNPSMAGYAAQIREFQPDLVTMEEATPTDVAQLQVSKALLRLPHQYEVSRTDSAAFFIASRYPIIDPHFVSLDGRPLIVKFSLQLPSGPLPVWVVHTIAPLPASFDLWKGQLKLIDEQLRARGADGLLVAGDFNSTWGTKGFRSILDAGLTDGAAARGEPFAMTWSQMMAVVPPMVRIDHILTGQGVAVTKIATGVGVGSDHRDLLATVAVDRHQS